MVEQKNWYELDLVKGMMGTMGGKALRGVSGTFIGSRIHSGKMGLIATKNYLDKTMKPEERRALIVTDDFTKKFAKKVTDILNLIGFECRIWDGAIPEVPMYTVDEGYKVCEEFKPKVLIAIGGGSVMDTVKAVFIKYEHPEMNMHLIIPILQEIGMRQKIKYTIAIPTTSGTGSEVTTALVATDTKRDPPKKIEILGNELVYDITILDPYFVKDMPPFLTMATGLDAFAHSMGSYVSNYGSAIIDMCNIQAIKETLKYLPRAYKYGAKDIEARQAMQMASTLAGMGFGNSTAGIDHSIGHAFGSIFHSHHGLTVGLFTAYSIAYQSKVTDRWMDLCHLFNIDTKDRDRNELLKEFLQAILNFVKSLDGPTCIKEMQEPKITEEQYREKIDILAEMAYRDAVTLTSYRPADVNGFKVIADAAWDGSIDKILEFGGKPK